MKKNIFRTVSVLLAALMVLFCCVSCKETEDNDPKDTSSADTTAPVTDAPGTSSNYKINGVDISKFVIIYATDDDRNKSDVNGDAKKDNDDELSVKYAGILSAKIKSVTGADVKVKPDTEDESEYEIIIGNVERDITNDFYKNTYENIAQYRVTVSGKKVAFQWLGEIALKEAVDTFNKKYLTKGTESFNVTDADSYAGDVKDSASVAINARLKESDIRIACNNIYAHQDFGRLSFYTNRKALLLSSIILWDADVLLFQEYGYDVMYSNSGTTWHTVLDPIMEELGYKQVPFVQDPNASENYTPIWYRPEKVEVIESKYYLYDTVKYRPNAHVSESKSYTMAVFKEKATGEQFACLSTHFTYCKDATLANQYRISDATEISAEVTSIKKKYGENFPIFVMGDLNCASGSEPYKILDEVTDNVIITPGLVRKNTHYKTHHEFGVVPAENQQQAIDHTMISGTGYKPVQYQYVINHWSLNSTDHLPLLLDVDFTS